MAIARPTKRQIKITSNQRKEIELDFFGIESFCMPKVNLFLKNEDKDAAQSGTASAIASRTKSKNCKIVQRG